MSGRKFGVGDLVWSKMKSYPYWPSKIVNPPENIKTPNSKKCQNCVFFFGTKNYAWISDDFIVPHSEEMVSNSRNNKKASSTLKSAIDEIVELSRNTPESSTPESSTPEGSITSENGEIDYETDEEILTNTSPQNSNSAEEIAIEEIVTENDDDEWSQSSSEESVIDILDLENENEDTTELLANASLYAEKNAEKIVNKIRKRILQSDIKRSKENSTKTSGNKRRCLSPEGRAIDEYSVTDNVPPDAIYSRAYVERPNTPRFDIEKKSDFFNSKNITPTNKKIGFLGLGMIGQGVVKNLIHSGHTVTVWNRSEKKCEPFVQNGACKGLTAGDVVASCDITFCCISDAMAVKCLVFGKNGVLEGFEGCTVGSKGYVEMTSIDPTTSLEISKAITSLGGRYLEAPIIGSRELADEGALLSLVAGDRELFNDCYSCFFAFTKNVYYLSSDIGSGFKMSLIQSMLFGTTSAALAEAMALVDRCQLSQESFLDILGMGPLRCPLVLDKGTAMVYKKFSTNTALKHQQRDLNSGLKLGNSCLQSTMTTSAANEVFKRAKFLNYADHDVSAVLMGVQL